LATYLQHRANLHIHPLAIFDESAVRIPLLQKYAWRVVRDIVSFVAVQVLEYLQYTVDENDNGEKGELHTQKQNTSERALVVLKTVRVTHRGRHPVRVANLGDALHHRHEQKVRIRELRERVKEELRQERDL
jgi:hypothetical protein